MMETSAGSGCHPFNGGVLATAGNLVFQGGAEGKFASYSADKGTQLWEAPAQTGIIAPPMTYAISGEQYVTVMAGWGGALGLVGGTIANAAGVPSISRVLTFKLDAKKVLPPAPARAQLPELAEKTEPVATIDRRRHVFNQFCSACHGATAVGGGVITDLRYLNSGQRNVFVQTVQNGIAAKGMPSFASLISVEDI